MKIEKGNGEFDDKGEGDSSPPYPDRPGEPDCIYYLRTGLCGYGSKCRFNHPSQPIKNFQGRGELPQRAGQPDCGVEVHVFSVLDQYSFELLLTNIHSSKVRLHLVAEGNGKECRQIFEGGTIGDRCRIWILCLILIRV